MSKRDYYEVLGVGRDCSEADLKKAFRRLAMKHHPDRNSDDPAGAETQFKEAKEAYEILSDASKRRAYDQFGHAGVDGSAGGGFGGGGFADIFGDMFGDIFGNGGGRRARGADIGYELELSLEEAVGGITREIRVPTWAACNTCSGSGAAPGSAPTTCSTCHGRGQVRMQQGFFSIQQACPVCRGRGSVISNPCRDCDGRGRVQEAKTLSVKIPPGVDSGDRIRLSGEGEAGESGALPGDLYVQIAVLEHPIFTRDGADLYCEVPVRFAQAALGGELEVPTLEGRAVVKVPAGTQSGKVFRLRGKGVRPVRGGPTGDLLARVTVETPVHLSSQQKEMLEAFDATLSDGGDRHSPHTSTWLDKVRQFAEKMGLT